MLSLISQLPFVISLITAAHVVNGIALNKVRPSDWNALDSHLRNVSEGCWCSQSHVLRQCWFRTILRGIRTRWRGMSELRSGLERPCREHTAWCWNNMCSIRVSFYCYLCVRISEVKTLAIIHRPFDCTGDGIFIGTSGNVNVSDDISSFECSGP